MGMRELCSYNSYWRGLAYFEEKRVKIVTKINDDEYEADVKGTELYHVHLNVKHLRKSTCTCPHAAGKSTICKHKAAVYFSIFQDEAQEAKNERDDYYKRLEKREKEYDKMVERITKRYEDYVKGLSEEEARSMLVHCLVDSYMENEPCPYDDNDHYLDGDRY